MKPKKTHPWRHGYCELPEQLKVREDSVKYQSDLEFIKDICKHSITND